MFKPEKNLKLSLHRHFVLFPRLLSVRFVSQTFANDVPHGYASFKHIKFCNVIIGYVGGMNKSMLDLYKKLESQERGEKREKMDSNWISYLSLLCFFPFSPLSLFLSLSLSFISIFFFTYTREAAAIVFLCMFAFRKQETFLLYLRLYKKLYYSNFRIFLSRPNCMQWSTLLSASLRRLFRNLWRIVIIIIILVRECHVLQSLLQNCTCPHRQGGATACQPSMAASFRMKRPTHCRQWDVQVLVSVVYRSRKIKSPTVRQCTFLQRNLAGTSSPMVGWQPCRRPPTTCSRRT